MYICFIMIIFVQLLFWTILSLMPTTSYPKAIGGVCQSTIDYPACRHWTVKRSAPIETNHIQPYIGHAQLNIRQASPQCI